MFSIVRARRLAWWAYLLDIVDLLCIPPDEKKIIRLLIMHRCH